MVDLAPTILELAGVSAPAIMDGASFAQQLLGNAISYPKTAALVEYLSIRETNIGDKVPQAADCCWIMSFRCAVLSVTMKERCSLMLMAIAPWIYPGARPSVTLKPNVSSLHCDPDDQAQVYIIMTDQTTPLQRFGW